MEYAHARRPRADDDFRDEVPPALRAVPDDLTPEERRDWQDLAERRQQRERAERGDVARRRHAVRPIESPSRRGAVAAGPAGETGATPRDSHGAATVTSPKATRGEVRGAPAPPRALPHPRRTLPAARRTAPAPYSSDAAPRRTAHIDTAPAPRRARRPRRLPTAGIAAGPDRLALWAVVLCLFMALVAAATARGHEPVAADQAAPAGAPVAESSGSPAPQR